MKGVILVGGEGTRLRPLTARLPKPMAPIVNQPFLERMIGWIRSHGVTDLVLAVCFLPEAIRAKLGDGSALGVSLSYVVEDTPLGTAGGVRNAAGHIDDTCFVFNGDILTDLDLTAMLRAHRAANALVSIALTPVDDPSQYGVVEHDESGRVLRFTEKPKREEARSNWINAGTYILDPAVVRAIPENTHWMFERHVFPQLVAAGKPVLGFRSNSYWIDIGTPDKYHTAHRDLLAGKLAIALGEVAAPGLWRGENTMIHADAQLHGPVVVGPGAVIGPNAVIRGPVVIGAECAIGAGATVVDSILWRRVTVGDDATVAHSLIADGARVHGRVRNAVIGAGAVIEPGNSLDHGIRIGAGRAIPADTITFG